MGYLIINRYITETQALGRSANSVPTQGGQPSALNGCDKSKKQTERERQSWGTEGGGSETKDSM